MQVEILKDNLKRALSSVERITRKAISLPVLQNVLLSTEGNFLELTTTNLETTIRWWVLAKIEKKGKLIVPASFLSSLISLIADEKIVLSSQNENLLIKSQNQDTQIQGQNPEDFPIIPKVEKNNYWLISSQQLFNSLSQLVDIPSTSQVRPEISGVYFLLKKDTLKVVATDSFRLAEKTIKLKQPAKKDDSFILPQNSARELLNISQQEEGEVKVYSDGSQVLFEFENQGANQSKISLLSRLIEGQYPNYQEIIPKKSATKIQIDRKEIENQIKKAGLFSGRSQEVKVFAVAKENQIKIISETVETGKSQATINCQITGQDNEVAFNHKFLLDGLINLKSSETILELSPENGPAALRAVGDISYLYILMPINKTS